MGDETTPTTEGTEGTETPPVTGGEPQERLLTQDEVNRIVGDRAKRAADAAISGLLSKLGLESTDALEQVITDHRERTEAEKSELQKAQDALAEAQRQATAAQAERDGAIVRNAVLVEAGKQGVPQERLEAALRLIDLNVLSIAEGEVEGVEEAVKSMLTANPFLLGDQPLAPPLDSGAGGGTRPGKGIRLTPLQEHLADISGMTREAYADYLRKQAERPEESIPPNFLRSSEDG